MARQRPLGRVHDRAANRLLASLPADEYARVQPHLSVVPLMFRQVLQSTGEPQRFVYFPAGGVCSMIATMEDGRMVEVGMVGKEGMVGAQALFGAQSGSCEVVVQVPGAYAYVMRTSVFAREMERGGPLYDVVARYATAWLGASMQSAACNGLHTADQRCARWLLQSHDRVEADRFTLTQEFLAVMLGVRRATVTLIAQQLQRAGHILLHRRSVTIRDRAGLEGVTCECYAAVKTQFDLAFG
jgi:CRP-like cAMP-binding protein